MSRIVSFMDEQKLVTEKPAKKKKHGKHKRRHKKIKFMKFDRESFLMAWGFGIVVSIIGVLLVGSTQKSPTHLSPVIRMSDSTLLGLVLPEETSDLLLFLLGNILLLVGLISIFAGIKIFAKFLSGKLKG